MLSARQILSAVVTDPHTTSLLVINPDDAGARYRIIYAPRAVRDVIDEHTARVEVARYWLDTFIETIGDRQYDTMLEELSRKGLTSYSGYADADRARPVDRRPVFDRLLGKVRINQGSTVLVSISTTSSVIWMPSWFGEDLSLMPQHGRIGLALFELLTGSDYQDAHLHALRELYPQLTQSQ